MKSIKVLLLGICLFFVSCNQNGKVTGDVFISGREAHRFTATQIKFFKKSRIDEIKARNEKPNYEEMGADARTSTNADGRFEVVLPQGEYIVFAKGTDYFNYRWEVPIRLSESEKTISLNESNARIED